MDVYKITNNINKKAYIGITMNAKERFQYHRTRCFQKKHKEYHKALYRAFRKHGIENFTFEILMTNLSKEEACQIEQDLIKKYQTTNSALGYNMTPGGELDYARGEQVNTAILKEADIIKIRTRKNAGETVAAVFEDYKHLITYSNFGKIWRNQYWKHIDIPLPENILPSGASIGVELIRHIKDLYDNHEYNAHQIAVKLNVEYRKVWRICTRRTYKNIT